MKQITNLAGSLIEADYREPRGAITTLHLEPVPGAHVQVILGAAGLVFRRGDFRIAYPLPELFKLAAEQLPELKAVEEQPATKPNLVAALAQRIKEQHQGDKKPKDPTGAN